MVQIYIGAEKTSTTYLQRLFRQNHAELRSRVDVQYLFGPKLSKTIVSVAKGSPGPLPFPKFDRTGKNIMISEFFYRDLSHIDEVNRFADIFRSRFDQIDVTLYVRDQVGWIESFYSTALKNGATWTFPDFVDHAIRNIRTLDFHKNIQMWQSVFGRSLHVYQYSGKNLLPELLKNLDVDPADINLVEPPPSNVALTVQKLDLLRDVNTAFASTDKLRPNPKKRLRKQIVRLIEGLEYGEGKVRVDDQMRRKIIERFNAGNTELNEVWKTSLPTL